MNLLFSTISISFTKQQEQQCVVLKDNEPIAHEDL